MPFSIRFYRRFPVVVLRHVQHLTFTSTFTSNL